MKSHTSFRLVSKLVTLNYLEQLTRTTAVAELLVPYNQLDLFTFCYFYIITDTEIHKIGKIINADNFSNNRRTFSLSE